ncbi:hook protein [Holotrichia oblita]|uniref:Hook protein n=1 Tax=Holotrichia oblita TaxID=644536 RepID=A0ACB9SVN6_HOLOL|nr:hook protein [Holotrichia oblita]
MAASSADIEEFLSRPLVAWLSTCVKKPEALQVYETFFDGSPLNEVLFVLIRTFAPWRVGTICYRFTRLVVMGKSPASQHALENLRLLLLLLLGCAVQGPTKEHFITKIKELPLETQHDIVECIKQVTNDQSVVLTEDATEQPPDKLYVHLRSLASERDVLFHSWIVDLGQETTATGVSIAAEGVHSNHLAIELADWKARLRKQRQELDEKNELLTECREELEHTNQLIAKLKTENGDLTVEARKGKLYRDEVDAMREKAERADKLEAEERDAVKEKLQELIDENIQLQQVTKDVLHETNTSLSLDSEADEPNSGDNSLSEQLTNNAQTRALKLELENRRLLSTIDSLKEQSFHEFEENT